VLKTQICVTRPQCVKGSPPETGVKNHTRYRRVLGGHLVYSASKSLQRAHWNKSIAPAERRPQPTHIRSLGRHSSLRTRPTHHNTATFGACFMNLDPSYRRLRMKCDGTRAETRFRLSAKRTSPFNPYSANVENMMIS